MISTGALCATRGMAYFHTEVAAAQSSEKGGLEEEHA